MPRVAKQRQRCGERSSFLSRSRIASLVLFVALGAVIVLRRNDLLAAIGVLSHIDLVPFVAAVAISALMVINRAAQFRAAHRLIGLDAPLGPMLRISSAAYALNKLVKTAGLGGMALFVRHGRQRGLPSSAVLAAYMLSSLAGHLALVGILGAGFVAVNLTDSSPRTWVLTLGSLVAMAAVGLPACWLVGRRSHATLRQWYPQPFLVCGRLAARVGLPQPPVPDPEDVDRFYQAATVARQDPQASLPLLGHALAAKILGAAVLYLSLIAVGAEVGPAAAIIVYTLALVAAASSLLPGGLGTVEASMTLLLVGYGTPTPVALAAILAFRLLDLWLPILVGLMVSIGLDVGTRAADGSSVTIDNPAMPPTSTALPTDTVEAVEAGEQPSDDPVLSPGPAVVPV